FIRRRRPIHVRPAMLSLFVLVSAGSVCAQPQTPADARSIERIRSALEDDRPRLATDLDQRATFHVDIRESRRFGELLQPHDFSSGPTPPGGLYMYEYLKRMMPGWTPPLVSVDVLPIARAIAS